MSLLRHGACALIALTVSCAATATPLKPGQWKMLIEADSASASIPGLPAGMKMPTLPAVTHSWCYQPKDGETLGETISESISSANRQQPQQNCEQLENQQTGDRLHYVMKCSDPRGGVAQVSGDFTLAGDKMSGTTQMNMQMPNGNMSMGSKISGEWLGPCEES